MKISTRCEGEECFPLLAAEAADQLFWLCYSRGSRGSRSNTQSNRVDGDGPPAAASCLPVVAFLAQLFLEVSQSEAVGFHHAAVWDLLAAEEIGDHQLLRPEDTKREQLYDGEEAASETEPW